jgi:hypothetical protein
VEKLSSNIGGEKKDALRLFCFSILVEKKKMHGFGFDLIQSTFC